MSGSIVVTEPPETASFFGYEFKMVTWQSGSSAWMHACAPGDLSPKIFITDSNRRAYRGGRVWDVGLYRGYPSLSNRPLLSISSMANRSMRWPKSMLFEAHRKDGFDIEFLTERDIGPRAGFLSTDLLWILSMKEHESMEVETSTGVARIVRTTVRPK